MLQRPVRWLDWPCDTSKGPECRRLTASIRCPLRSRRGALRAALASWLRRHWRVRHRPPGQRHRPPSRMLARMRWLHLRSGAACGRHLVGGVWSAGLTVRCIGVRADTFRGAWCYSCVRSVGHETAFHLQGLGVQFDWRVCAAVMTNDQGPNHEDAQGRYSIDAWEGGHLESRYAIGVAILVTSDAKLDWACTHYRPCSEVRLISVLLDLG